MQCQADIIEIARAVQGVEGLEKSVFKFIKVQSWMYLGSPN